ncbi:GLPGLI family protein [Nonlabens sp.]|uniref:GLPGLI family protein n=1 Tax=Nonlabens sp. TaxID=1888209 RepID=UPI0032668C5D
MKLTYLFIFFNSFLLFGQNLQVTYKASYNGTSVKEGIELAKKNNIPNGQLQGFKYYLQKVKDDIENQKIILNTIGDDQFILSLPSSVDSDYSLVRSIAPVSLGLYDYLYSKGANIIIGVNDLNDHAVLYDDKQATWLVTSESKNILGFECFKATIKYKQSLPRQFARDHVEAWFAPSINKRGGPIVYTNLPGLILEVKVRNATITASNIETGENKVLKETTKQIITEFESHKKATLVGKAIEERIKK